MAGFGGPAGPMGPMGGPNQRRNPLDPIIYNFQHRWETDRQFRAAFSAITAVITVVLLCACVGVASTLATSAIASATGGSSSSGGSLDTGTGHLSGNQPIPTNTVAPWNAPSFPQASPNPNSQTPPPSPSAGPSPTDTPAGGPGPIPTVTTCGGGGSGITYSFSPSCPLVHSQPGTLSIHVPGYAGHSLNILIEFNISNCTLDFTPANTPPLDGSGRANIGFTVPACGANSQYDIGGMINVSGGPTTGINAAPVQ
ncbi:MAG: hypothetical protein ABI068_17605 [Ktedonobacterales bacterium]